jgi:hypothetical protein
MRRTACPPWSQSTSSSGGKFSSAELRDIFTLNQQATCETAERLRAAAVAAAAAAARGQQQAAARPQLQLAEEWGSVYDDVQLGESFLRVHWVAVPEAMCARRVNSLPRGARFIRAARRRRRQRGECDGRGWAVTQPWVGAE